MVSSYYVTFDKQNSRIGFNAPTTSEWGQIFLFLQYSLTAIMALVLAFGLWLLWEIRLVKSSKHKKKKGSKPNPACISMSFIEPY